jgi:hypothetical protein
MLVACFAIKLFGGNWFEVVCTNEHFILVCDFIDRNIVLENCIAYFLYVIFTTILLMAVCRETSFQSKNIIIIASLISFVWISHFINENLKFSLEIFSFIFLPIFINKGKTPIKKVWYYGLIGIALDILFQMISFYIRGVKVAIIGDGNTLLSLILMVDYYIMILLHFLLVKQRKEKKYGQVGNFLF